MSDTHPRASVFVLLCIIEPPGPSARLRARARVRVQRREIERELFTSPRVRDAEGRRAEGKKEERKKLQIERERKESECDACDFEDSWEWQIFALFVRRRCRERVMRDRASVRVKLISSFLVNKNLYTMMYNFYKFKCNFFVLFFWINVKFTKIKSKSYVLYRHTIHTIARSHLAWEREKKKKSCTRIRHITIYHQRNHFSLKTHANFSALLREWDTWFSRLTI